MIKAAFVINYIARNGPSSVVLNIVRNLDPARFEIAIITLFPGNDPHIVQEMRARGVTVKECTSLSRAKCLLGFSREFTGVIQEGQYDILHTHGVVADVLSARLRDPARRITTIHNNMFEDYPDTYGRLKSRALIWLHMRALKKLDECVCCSWSVYEAMKPYLRRATCIHNGIARRPAATHVTRSTLNIPETARVYLYAGVLDVRKNVEWMIQNFVRCRQENEYLLVLGEGAEREACAAAADDSVRMMGFQPDPIAYMNLSDVYVSASRAEGFSISVLEALSCGMKLFLSNIPSHREIFEVGSVYIGECFDLDGEFGAKLNRLRAHLNDSAREQVAAVQRQYFDAAGMAASYAKLYAEPVPHDRRR